MKYIPRSSFSSTTPQSSIPQVVKKRRRFRVLGFLGTLMIIVSVGAAIGSIFYKEYLDTKLAEVKAKLQEQSSSSDERKIEEIGAFDTKLRQTAYLLGNHLAPSSIFKEIEKQTKQTVQFTSFKYTYDPGFEVLIEMDGRALEFSPVALQKAELAEGEIFSEFLVRDITNSVAVPNEEAQKKDDDDEEDGVTFRIKGVLETSRFTYTGEENDSQVGSVGGAKGEEATAPESVAEVESDDVTVSDSDENGTEVTQ